MGERVSAEPTRDDSAAEKVTRGRARVGSLVSRFPLQLAQVPGAGGCTGRLCHARIPARCAALAGTLPESMNIATLLCRKNSPVGGYRSGLVC